MIGLHVEKIVVSIMCFISLLGTPLVGDGQTTPHEDTANMTKMGPRLSKNEEARMAQLSVPELVDMIKNSSDDRYVSAAIRTLKKDDGWKTHFDLLLDIARQVHGNMIVEGLVRPVDINASSEEKQRMEKFLDFLENQLFKQETPSVSRPQAVRSLSQAVYKDISIMKPRATQPDEKKISEPPYATERVLKILSSCLDNKDWQVRKAAIHWLGTIIWGNKLKMAAKETIPTLMEQSKKETLWDQNEETKKEMEKVIGKSIKFLKGTIDWHESNKDLIRTFCGPRRVVSPSSGPRISP
jgi:hypothetical protein